MENDKLILALIGLGVAAWYFTQSNQGSDNTEYYSPEPTTDDYSQYYLTAPEPDTSMANLQSVFDLSTSQAGRTAIQSFEGWRRNAYQDTVGNWTIGVGHKIVPGDGLSPQSVLTDQQVLDLFNQDLGQVENVIKGTVRVPISQGMFDALADFVFQFGSGNFASSTLLRKLNAGDYTGAEAEFPKWVHAGGVVVAQLVDRRASDQQMFAV